MRNEPSNLVLIGMPGAGKSTVGVILARITSRDFLDTDVLIQSVHEQTLQEIVDKQGYAGLRKIEEKVLVGLRVQNHVIATGGSAAYSEIAMRHLKLDAVVVFLDVDLAELESRVADYSIRGLAKRPDQSFSELYDERHGLYKKYADVTIMCSGLTQEDVCATIVRKTGM